jgi:hypothetical protein
MMDATVLVWPVKQWTWALVRMSQSCTRSGDVTLAYRDRASFSPSPPWKTASPCGISIDRCHSLNGE